VLVPVLMSLSVSLQVILMPGQRKMELASQRIPQFNQYLKVTTVFRAPRHDG